MSKITRRSYKRKKIVMGIALFGAIGLVSTGFAAWVLSSNASKDQSTGMKVGVVAENSMTITNVKVKGIDTKRSSPTLGEEIETTDFSFNPKWNDNTGRVRFGAEGDDCGERLSLTITGTITEAQNLGSLTIGPKVVPDKVNQAKEANYITVPACLTSTVTLVENTDYQIKVNEGITTADFTFKVEFGWGSLFNGMNPAEYYDDMSETDVPTSQINSTLTAMHGLLDGLEVSVEIIAHVN